MIYYAKHLNAAARAAAKRLASALDNDGETEQFAPGARAKFHINIEYRTCVDLTDARGEKWLAAMSDSELRSIFTLESPKEEKTQKKEKKSRGGDRKPRAKSSI